MTTPFETGNDVRLADPVRLGPVTAKNSRTPSENTSEAGETSPDFACSGAI